MNRYLAALYFHDSALRPAGPQKGAEIVWDKFGSRTFTRNHGGSLLRRWYAQAQSHANLLCTSRGIKRAGRRVLRPSYLEADNGCGRTPFPNAPRSG